jgi:pimeloyl-ACP methyl ester carboxylesterase
MFKALIGAVVTALLVLAGSAGGATSPLDVSGELHGAPYRIVVPADWNGTLVVFAHGYRDLADHPGEVDNRSAPVAPDAALEPPLLAQGYALAGSAFATNGWAVREGIGDTRSLVSAFRSLVGQPKRTLLWGFSMGSLVTLQLAEETAGHFDGYLAACSIGAGAPRAWDGALATSVAYDAAFGWSPGWGTVGDVRDNVDFETEVLPALAAGLLGPSGFARSEFIRLVTGAVPSQLPAPSFPTWLVTNMFFATEGRAELERRAGGPIAQNVTHTYSLSAADKAYLALLGLNADPLLAFMNAHRDVSADPSARNYAEHYADFTGRIKKPVLTLHTRTDSLVPVQHEAAYAATVDESGRDDLLARAYTTGNGHCAFTGSQLLTALGALDRWVTTGVKPTDASFPAALGFLPGFTPPAWPQP